MLLNTKESKPRVSAHFLLPCTEQAFSQAQPPPPTLLGKLICSVLLAPVRELLLLVRVLSVFCSPPRSRQPSHHQLQLFCLLNFLVPDYSITLALGASFLLYAIEVSKFMVMPYSF
ncbi:hypothetical protein SLEP1_g22247 [Rubroshorea leprosula]|uniref:Uncharacterized protein n=1 Tax=Rubroshorea leprosula TaxID=152421 RepID=A0AAV5JHV3_9ROSI|nr:hypothetical protein SLEP1_g22247 [Rubroshorea leprosula]